MSHINRVGSPMDRLDESLDEAPEKINLRKQLLKSKQRTKSPFLIGSMEEVSYKISKLDQKLQSYTALVCESRASNFDEDKYRGKNAESREQYIKQAKDTKEVRTFAGLYTIKSTLIPSLSDKVKNITKISMKSKKKNLLAATKNEMGKPKFVELQQYPGYDPKEVTPLPGGLLTRDMYNKAVIASGLMKNKANYRIEFEHLLYSPMSEAILQDTFWWLFLEKFQANPISQAKLFSRVAHNYVHLMMQGSDTYLKDMFFTDYPKLVSQAVYTAFCFSFPDSYRLFGESFKNDITFLVYGWMAGIRPAPRNWLTWDMSALEPANLKQREELMNKKSGNSIINLDYLESLVSTNPAQASAMPTAHSTSRSSTNSYIGSRKPQGQAGCKTSSPHKSVSPTSSQVSVAIEAVAEAQYGNRVGRVHKENKEKFRSTDALTPIREISSEADGEDEITKTNVQNIWDVKASNKHEIKSHPVGRSCDFVKVVFNTEGKSPLVSHFLQMAGLQRDAGQIIRLQRVEVENLPPLDAPTYKDVISESSRSIKRINRDFQNMRQSNHRMTQALVREQQANMRDFLRKQTSLLSNKKEVKRLSDLIIMEQRKSEDSVSAGADTAIVAALMGQE
ncbi:unnamed protein product [Lymnaea stagnalis]|uniref:Protein FAM227B n=1 Tax=Lymnaea stagnalis TaxID=6523 RepID=A0AAV2HV31_LYMST